jgi:ABC-type transporter MlaC component
MAQDVNTELWEKMTPTQRETFRAAFEHRMISSCVKQFRGYEGQNLQVLGVRTTQSGNLLATVRVGSQDDGKQVTWRLRNYGSERWRAVDVITEGRSMVGDARVEFAAVLQSMNGDIEALIAFLQK